MINVTKSFLPPLDEYEVQLKKIWHNHHLTNRGPLTLELEQKLTDYLTINNIIITNNGTIPLQIALNKFGLNGEIITTPFSYVATTSAIVWTNCTPVFVDIDKQYLTINPDLIEAAITKNTTSILATHVFGNPCDIEQIEIIAKKYNLKIIYDAAHCFGVKYKNTSIFNYGDVSTCSFHATKLFHTGEGGAIFCNNKELLHELFYRHNFGHNGPYDFYGLGINAKISELQSALGLSVLPYIDDLIYKRSAIVNIYDNFLNWKKLQRINIRPNTEWNYSYYPVIFESEDVVLKVISTLMKDQINPRRYFYPSLNKLNYLDYKSMPISEDISKRILCLPLYADLELNIVTKIINLINTCI